MHFDRLKIPSPKRDRRSMSGWEDFFPYYAGYPETFVDTVLKSARLRDEAVVVDPWNGSGTTTFVAANLRHRAIGIDLNPVMVVVAKARLLMPSEADSIKPIGSEIVSGCTELPELPLDDPLLQWFDYRSALRVRALEVSLRTRLVGGLTLTNRGVVLDNLSSLAASFYVALFATCRDLTAKFRSSNPTWIKRPRGEKEKVSVTQADLARVFSIHLTSLTAALACRAERDSFDSSFAKIRHGDSTTKDLGTETIDFVLTSPPYCTRIDYTAATRIQLAVMNPLVSTSFIDLSRQMTGSTRVPLNDLAIDKTWGRKCCLFLNQVGNHRSKASSAYYLKTHLDYFDKLGKSLDRIARALKVEARAVFVVQDSYYKEIHNDLPAIVTEMANLRGLRLVQRRRFELMRTLAGVHPHAKLYRRHLGAVESVLCFEKRANDGVQH